MCSDSGHETLIVEVDDLDNHAEAKAFLNEQTKKYNSRTFPKTYINGHYIGGNSDLQKLVY